MVYRGVPDPPQGNKVPPKELSPPRTCLSSGPPNSMLTFFFVLLENWGPDKNDNECWKWIWNVVENENEHIWSF